MPHALGICRAVAPYMPGLPRRNCATATASNNRAGGAPVMKVFSSSATWVAPPSTSRVESISGNGAAGDAGFFGPDINRSATVDTVSGNAGTGGSLAGIVDWSLFANDAPSAASAINGGGSGSFTATDYEQFNGDNTHNQGFTNVPYANAIVGSATSSTSGGWKTSGAILSGDSGSSSVAWREQGAFNPPTTGASSTALGKTFAGGTGGPASTTTFTKVAVTPGSSNSIVVPSGGSVTITYYQ